jgi:flagellin
MISLQTNVDSLNAQTNLNTNKAFQSKTIEQLTSGYRINSSGDDAAGLAIANTYRSSVNELSQGVANANNGVSQLQIVDGGLSNISTILDRLKTLATQSASGTFTGDRTVLNQEFQGLLTEIDRQAQNINLDGSGSLKTNLSVYIGGGSGTNATVTVDLSNAAVDSAGLGLTGTRLTDTSAGAGDAATNATNAINKINDAVKALGLVQGSVGAGENKLNYAISLAQSQISNFSAAESQIRDADVAADASNLTKSQVLVQTSVAAMAQANSEPQAVLKLLQG